MKKILFVLPLIAMTFMACGNKSVSVEEIADQDTVVLDTVETDTVDTADTIIILDKVF